MTLHRCPWPDCDKMVAHDKFACREHWSRLPNRLRIALGRAYRHGVIDGTHPNDAYREAIRSTLQWLSRQRPREYHAPIDDGERNDLPC